MLFCLVVFDLVSYSMPFLDLTAFVMFVLLYLLSFLDFVLCLFRFLSKPLQVKPRFLFLTSSAWLVLSRSEDRRVGKDG